MSILRKMVTATGYGEWAHYILSIQNGCSFDGYGDPDAGGCRYCWARDQACTRLRHLRGKTPETWTSPKDVRWDIVHKTDWGRLDGRVGYPGTHDISLDLVGPTVELLANLLAEENEILLVTKPRHYAVKAICDTFADHPNRSGITWRFTITSPDDDDLTYWEPNAPPFGERIGALSYAYHAGYAVSVNTEPLTCPVTSVPVLWEDVRPWLEAVSGIPAPTFWVGFMNQATRRVVCDPDGRLPALLEDQSRHAAQWLYQELGNHPAVRWKNSIKDLLGLPRNPRPGMDE